MATPRFDAALLTGGRSSRMGRDKALLPWPEPNSGPLYLHQLETLRALEPQRLFLCGEPPPGSLPEDVSNIQDVAAERGPLGGIVAALEAATSPWLLVLAVDLPLLDADYLGEKLLGAMRQAEGEEGAPTGLVPRRAGRWEPLAALYPTDTFARAARNALASEALSVQSLVDGMVAEGHLRPWEVPPEDYGRFSNLNHPEDYARLQSSASTRIGLRRYRTGRSNETPSGSSVSHDAIQTDGAEDDVAREEPLEIRVEGRSIAVTMRTPGHDEELAAGFLATEGVLECREELFEVTRCPALEGETSWENVVDVLLANGHETDLEQLTRHVFTSSSCGICGKATLEAVLSQHQALPADTFHLLPETLLGLPDSLRSEQATFRHTGGLHASALFSASGELRLLREDVGRHNALDKVIGRSLLDDSLPLSDCALLVSGRISFELMQKALAAGIPFVAGISAPSSLAVDLALRSGQTLVGFLREHSFNLYAGEQRLLRS